MGIYLQVYNFGPDEKTQKPAGSIEYEIDKSGFNEKILGFSEDVAQIAERIRQPGDHRKAGAAEHAGSRYIYDQGASDR